MSIALSKRSEIASATASSRYDCSVGLGADPLRCPKYEVISARRALHVSVSP